MAWNSGVGGVSRKLGGGKQLAKGLRLGLVVSTHAFGARSGALRRRSDESEAPKQEAKTTEALHNSDPEPLEKMS